MFISLTLAEKNKTYLKSAKKVFWPFLGFTQHLKAGPNTQPLGIIWYETNSFNWAFHVFASTPSGFRVMKKIKTKLFPPNGRCQRRILKQKQKHASKSDKTNKWHQNPDKHIDQQVGQSEEWLCGSVLFHFNFHNFVQTFQGPWAFGRNSWRCAKLVVTLTTLVSRWSSTC